MWKICVETRGDGRIIRKDRRRKCFKEYKMENSLRRTVIKFICILFCSICFGVCSLYSVFALPTEEMDMHVKMSADTFEKEQTYPTITKWCTSQLDNFTDSIMLLSAVYDGTEADLEKAMKVKYNRVSGENPTQSLIKQYKYGMPTYQEEYVRYWHGYLLFLKPLLLYMSYEKIRILNLITQTAINLCIVQILNIKK